MITDSAVYSDEVTIEAPVELVWDILIDFENYGQWNSFCPQATCESLTLGTPIDMRVDMGQGLFQQVEYISRVEPLSCLGWAMENKPEDPVHAERLQHLKRLDDQRCTYISMDQFGGPGMKEMMDGAAAAVEEGFNRCAQDLKRHAEALHKGIQ
ncbi:MAG: SRPBCC domain-containing protein [Halieaceae bacterium]|nr:SRPBCC domain-containing protein [Halieaceae bacterium]